MLRTIVFILFYYVCLHFFPKALRASGSRLVVWRSRGRGRGPPWGHRGVTEASSRRTRSHGAWRSFFEEVAFPWSVALKVLGATSAAALSRVMFSNIWDSIVVFMWHRWRSRALFSDSAWASIPFLEVCFSIVVFR